MRIAALPPILALALAGCASPGPAGGPRGNVDLALHLPSASGRVESEGEGGSTGGGPLAATPAASADVLFRDWILSAEFATTFLPSDLDLAGSRGLLSETAVVAGPRILEVPREGKEADPALRIDAFAGGRLRRLVLAEESDGLDRPSSDEARWIDAVAGLRAEARVAGRLAVRLRGDTRIGGYGSGDAWRASAAFVLGAERAACLVLGWEVSSVEFEEGSGGGFFRYDVLLSGPFLALEFRF